MTTSTSSRDASEAVPPAAEAAQSETRAAGEPNHTKRLRADTGAHQGERPSLGDSGTRETKEERERGGPAGPRQRRRVWFQGRRAARGQHDRTCRALRFQICKVTLECSLQNTTFAETKLFLRTMDIPGERKTAKVPRWGRPLPLQMTGV